MADFAPLKVSLSKLRLYIMFILTHRHQTHLHFACLLGPFHTLPPCLLQIQNYVSISNFHFVVHAHVTSCFTVRVFVTITTTSVCTWKRLNEIKRNTYVFRLEVITI